MSTRRKNLIKIKITDTPSANTGLWLDKYILDLTKSDPQNYSNFVRDISLHASSIAYNEFYARWEKMLGEFNAKTRKATVKGRMIIGLGNESVLETSVTLHHTYGVPYIPGSALKGLAASYARQKLGVQWQKDSEKENGKEKYNAYNVIFGNTDAAGYITFFDALYIPGSGHQGKALYPDIITVHHKDYYNSSKNSVPADWDSPNPVPLMSATGSYLIALAAPDLPLQNEWILRTFDILKLALKDMGIGAKTSSGYGRMEFEIDQNGPGMEEVRAFQQKLDSTPANALTSRFDGLFSEWNKLPSNEAKVISAKAIIKKIESAGIEQTMASRPKYKVLKSFEADK